MKRFDCHCHIFNIANVGLKAILEHSHDAHIESSKSTDSSKTTEELTKHKESLRKKLAKIAELIKIFTDSSEKIFDLLDNHYNGEYILFPLMFDGDFLLQAFDDKHHEHIKQLLEGAHNSEKNAVTAPLLEAGGEDAQVLLNYLKNVKEISNPTQKSAHHKDGWQTQYDAIVKMMQDSKYKDKMKPFLGVDPRREGITSHLKEVGPGKTFAGVKVYPPNGFSPTDEILVGENSVFEFCAKYNIPIITHNSYGGFATPEMNIEVQGMIMPKDAIAPVEYDGTYSFSKSLFDGFETMVCERAGVLNNPLIWEEVLKIYPNLTLQLAHFGSGSTEWQQTILRLMKSYKNVYTDVSCMSNPDILQQIKDIYEGNEDIRHKILYGSDYFLDMFFNDSFNDYLNRMKDAFGQDMFDALSIQNPKQYMERWYTKVTEEESIA